MELRNLIKDINKKSRANIILNSQILNIFPFRLGTRQRCSPLATVLILDYRLRKGKERNSTYKIWKAKVKQSGFLGDKIVSFIK